MKWILGQKKEESQAVGLVGIHITARGVAMAYALSEEPGITPHFRAEYYEKLDDFAPEIQRFVFENKLETLPCNYVIAEQDYTLNLVDTPNVTQEEMDRALQWLVREYINYPVTEAIMDGFTLPLPRARDNVKMSYVAVIRKSLLPRIEDLIKRTGLELKTIDIPELVLRNIAHLHPAESKGVVFIYLHPWGGKLMVCRGGLIYITRSLDLRLEVLQKNSIKDEKTQPVLEQLSLEIQRSLDYSSTTFRQSVVTSILLSPTLLNQELIGEYLKESLGMEVHLMDLGKLLPFDQAVSMVRQADCLMAIGAVLRENEKIDVSKAIIKGTSTKENKDTGKGKELNKETTLKPLNAIPNQEGQP